MHKKGLETSIYQVSIKGRGNETFANAYYFDLYLLFLRTRAEGCTIWVRTKWMTPLSLNTIIKSMFFVQVNIEPVVHVYSNDTDVFVILVSCLHQLNCKSVYLNWSTEELIDLTLRASGLGNEKAKALAGFHVLTGCDPVEKFTGKSKEAWTKHFLQADSKVLNAFCRYSQEHLFQ